MLITYQTVVTAQPGMERLRIQDDVPYQQMQCSLNADVGCHKDTRDEVGTTIIWLALTNTLIPSIATASPTDVSASTRLTRHPPGATFVIYDLGFLFKVGHLTHLWVRSDRYFHGTIRNVSVNGDRDLLLGTAFANNREVLTKALQVLNTGGLITWERKYDTEEPASTLFRRHGGK